MLSYQQDTFHNIQFVSPILDMQQVCEDLMHQAGITADQLQRERIMPTDL